MLTALYLSIAGRIFIFQLARTCTVEEFFKEFLRQCRIWRSAVINPMLLCQCFGHMLIIARIFKKHKNPFKTSLCNRKFFFRHNQIRIESVRIAKSIAFRACPKRRIKGKHSRLHFLHRYPVLRTGKLSAKSKFLWLRTVPVS